MKKSGVVVFQVYMSNQRWSWLQMEQERVTSMGWVTINHNQHYKKFKRRDRCVGWLLKILDDVGWARMMILAWEWVEDGEIDIASRCETKINIEDWLSNVRIEAKVWWAIGKKRVIKYIWYLEEFFKSFVNLWYYDNFLK